MPQRAKVSNSTLTKFNENILKFLEVISNEAPEDPEVRMLIQQKLNNACLSCTFNDVRISLTVETDLPADDLRKEFALWI